MAANIKFKRTSTTTLPTGLTFAEPAFVLGSAGTTTANQLYVGDNSGGRVWVGAKIENTVTSWTGTEANTLLATQQAIDARITSRISTSGGFTFAATSGTPQTLTPGDTITIAAGSGISTTAGATDTVTIANTGVLSFNGSAGAVTGVSSNIAGTAISVSGATGNVTITNTGVQSAAAGSGISISGATGAVTFTNTGVTGIQAGTGIAVSSSTGNPTITNIGVTGLTGTANQITVSGTTGSITLSLPSAITTPGSLTVTGNLTVNGTTTTVNSTTVTVQDPIIAIGGLTGNIPPVSGDTKDRGIVAQYRNTSDTAGLTGFFGIDQSTGYFTFVPNATVTSEVISGTVGAANFNSLVSSSGVTLAITSTTDTIDFYGGGSSNTKIRLYDSNPLYAGTLALGGLAANQTYTLPNATGTVLVYGASGNTNQITSVGTITSGTWNGATLGLAYGGTNKSLTAVNGGIVWSDADSLEISAAGTSGQILKSNGAAAPTWQDPTASGFTAYAATNVTTTEQSTGTFYLTFTTGAASAAALSVDATATTALSYNVATGTLTATAVDALIDGGAY